MPAQRDDMLVDPNGRLAKQFRKMFHTPYEVFLDLMNLAMERWCRDWNEDNRCQVLGNWCPALISKF